MTTGVITTPTPHGLTVNQTLMLQFNAEINQNYCPNEWFADIDYLVVKAVISTTQFRLGKISTDFTSYVTKGTVDMSKIHFETTSSSLITINGFKTNKLMLRIYGQTGKGDVYITPNELLGNSWQQTNAFFATSGLALSSNATHALFRNFIGEAIFHFDETKRCFIQTRVHQWIINGSTPAITDKSVTPGYATSKIPFANGFITSMNINGSQSQFWANGTICELYDLS